MSDVDPGGWVRADDGRWYPPDAVPPTILRRRPDGPVVLDPTERARDDDIPGVTRRRRASDRQAEDEARRAAAVVGGPIQPNATIHFGRPPGTENRQAGLAATVGGMLLVAAVALPWAVRSPAHLDPSRMGWRDADGALGPGWLALLIGLGALGLGVTALRGRTDPWMRGAFAAGAGAALVLAAVDGVRILRADDAAARASDGLAGVSPSWGLLSLAAGGAALGVAAVVHRAEPPAWRLGETAERADETVDEV